MRLTFSKTHYDFFKNQIREGNRKYAKHRTRTSSKLMVLHAFLATLSLKETVHLKNHYINTLTIMVHVSFLGKLKENEKTIFSK